MSQTQNPLINRFSGPYAFLSNFHPSEVWLDGLSYASVEHAFQAAKTLGSREGFRQPISPALAKRLGRQVALRPRWDEMRLDIMLSLIRQKFSTEPLRSQLLATGDAPLEEGNIWEDEFWGTCNGHGQNHLGQILMSVREEIRKSQSEPQGKEEGEIEQRYPVVFDGVRWSALRVCRSAAGYYLGRMAWDPMGFEEAGTRESSYFQRRDQAESALKSGFAVRDCQENEALYARGFPRPLPSYLREETSKKDGDK